MRKILSLVLVLSMVLGSFGFAFAAPADVDGTDYEDAVTRLEALEILSGYADGTFKPEKTITRAEFAKVMAHALGVGEAAQYAKGQTKFADVPADHWAAGYINVASDTKIINGYGDGNFGPQDQVTYAQAVTMLVRALGYEPKAKAMGGYPGGYLAVAAEKDITEDVSIVNTLAATRGDVALMVDASLDVSLMVQKTYGQFPEYEEDETKSLLTTKLDVDEIKSTKTVKAIVTAIPKTDSALDDNEIRINGDKYTVLVDVNYDSLLGLEVKAWSDDDEIVFLNVETEDDNIWFDTTSGKSTKDSVPLYVEDDNYDWTDDAKAFVNFDEVKLDEIPADAYGYFVVNEKDEVTYANVFDFDHVAAGVVYEIDDDKYQYVDRSKDDDADVELSDYKDGIFIYNDKMVLVDTDEIKVNSAIYAWETSDELYLIVKNDVKQGKLGKIKDDEIEVDDESYDRHASNGAVYSDDKFDTFHMYTTRTDLDNLGGEQVTLVLDLNGEVQLIYGDTEATSSTMYGIVTYGETGSKAKATVFTKDDDEFDYNFETRADGSVLEGLGYFEKQDTDNSNANLEFAVMKYKLNSDGEIADGESVLYKIEYGKAGSNGVMDLMPGTGNIDDGAASPTVVGEVGALVKSTSDSNRVEIAGTRYYISEDTVFLSALSDSSGSGKLSPGVVKYEDIYESKIDSNNLVAVFGEAGKDADMIVFLDKDFEGSNEDVFYGIVTEAWTDGSDDMVKIHVYDGEEKTYEAKTRNHFLEGKLVAFKLNTDNQVVLASENSNQDTDIDKTEYNDGWIDNLKGGSRKIVSNAVVYTLNSSKEADDKIVASKIDNYETFHFLYNKDGEIVVGAVDDELDLSSDGGSSDVSGVVAEEVTTNIAVYDGKAYNLANTTLVYDKHGTLIGSGGTYINGIGTTLKALKADIVANESDTLTKITINESFVDGSGSSAAITYDADTRQELSKKATITVSLVKIDTGAYAKVPASAFDITVADGTGNVTIGTVTESTGTPGDYTFTAQNDAVASRVITVKVDGTTVDTATLVSYSATAEADQLAVDTAKAGLDYSDMTFTGAEDKDTVKGNIAVLDADGDVAISWASSNTSIISVSGTTATVSRDTSDDSDDQVVLTATLTKGAASETKTFVLNVIEAQAPTVTSAQAGSITISNGGTASFDIEFSEALDSTGQGNVESALDAAKTETTGTVKYSWSGSTLTVEANEATYTIAFDATSAITADLVDANGNTTTGATIVTAD